MKRWDFPGGNFFSMSCGETPSYVFFLTLWFLSFYYNRALTLLNIWLMKIGLLHGWTVQYFIFCIRCCREPSNSAEIEIMQHSDKVRKVMWSSQERKEEYKKEAIGKCVCVLQLLDIAAALQFWNASAAEALKHQIEWDKFVLRINLQFIYICISMWSADKKKNKPWQSSWHYCNGWAESSQCRQQHLGRMGILLLSFSLLRKQEMPGLDKISV